MKNFIIGLIVLIVVIIGIVLFIVLRGNATDSDTPAATTNSPQSIQKTATADTLTLKNLGLAKLAPYDKPSSTSGDVAVTNDALRELSRGLKGFYIFGEPLEGNRLNPNFEFSSVKEGAKVVAAIDGVVTFIKEQPETGDVEVFLQPKQNSQWTVGYDHLTNVTVKQGDTVTAGQPLGEAAKQNNGSRRFEIQINKDVNGTTTHVCPSTLLDPTIKDALLADLLTMQNAWESLSGKDLYNTDEQSPIGCVSQTLTPAQAEGR